MSRETFGNIRSVIGSNYHPYYKWQLLLREFSEIDLDDPYLDIMIHYCLDFFRKYDEQGISIRSAPREWIAKRHSKIIGQPLVDIAYRPMKFSHPALILCTKISLADEGIADSQLFEILESPLIQNVTHLDLDNNMISDDGLEAILNSSHLKKIYVLHMSRNKIKGIPTKKERLLKEEACRVRVPSLQVIFLDGQKI